MRPTSLIGCFFLMAACGDPAVPGSSPDAGLGTPDRRADVAPPADVPPASEIDRIIWKGSASVRPVGFSKDGTKFVFLTSWDSISGELYVHDVATGDTELTDENAVAVYGSVAMSDDGTRLAYRTKGDEGTDWIDQGTLWTWGWGDAAPVKIADQVWRANYRPTPDGRRVVYRAEDGALMVYDVAADQRLKAAEGAPIQHLSSPEEVFPMSDDGRYLAWSETVEHGLLHVLDVETLEDEVVDPDAFRVTLQWRGRSLAYHRRETFDTARLVVRDMDTGEEVATSPGAVQPGWSWAFRLSPTGRYVAYLRGLDTEANEGELVVYDLTAGEEVLTRGGVHLFQHVWGPGDRLAFLTDYADHAGALHAWSAGAGTVTLTDSASTGFAELSSVWFSGDGARIAWFEGTCNAEDHALHVADADTGQTLLAHPNVACTDPRFVRGGDSIVFVTPAYLSAGTLTEARLDDGAIVEWWEDVWASPAASPDGERTVHVQTKETATAGPSALHVVRWSDGEVRTVYDGDGHAYPGVATDMHVAWTVREEPGWSLRLASLP